jgi:hypothetical protein
MASIGTTSIESLPVNPQNNSNSQPIQQIPQIPQIQQNQQIPQIQQNQQIAPHNESQNIKIENYGQQLNVERQQDSAMQQIDYSSQLQSTLKEASAVGATILPSRDIPQNTLSMQQDESIKPNFVPNKSNDYIGDIMDREKIIQDNARKQNQSDNLDYFYQQLQLPLLVGLIYFLFQLPIIRTNVLAFLPSLFNKDGNPNLSGYIFNSVMFGLIYLLLVKGITQFNY